MGKNYIYLFNYFVCYRLSTIGVIFKISCRLILLERMHLLKLNEKILLKIIRIYWYLI